MKLMIAIDLPILGTVHKIYGYEDDCAFTHLKQQGHYAEFDFENLRPLIRPNSICLDIGASVGIMSIAMGMLATEGMIYAYEASEMTYQALVRTTESRANIQTFHMIVGRQDGAG